MDALTSRAGRLPRVGGGVLVQVLIPPFPFRSSTALSGLALLMFSTDQGPRP